MQYNIRIIKQNTKSVLVEWVEENGKICRCVLPSNIVHGNMVEYNELLSGIPYGIDWEAIATVNATPAKIANELRRVGIWTADDLLQQPQAALGAIQKAYSLDLASLIRLAQISMSKK